MTSRGLWKAVIAGAVTGLVLAGVYLLASRIGGPGRGEHGGAGSGGHGGAGSAAGLALAQAPPGQPPAQNLKVDRLRDAFNASSGEPRVILSLSPT